MKSTRLILLSLLGGIAFTSCLSSSSSTTKEMTCDASIEVKVDPATKDTVYAPTYYVQTNYNAQSAVAYLDPSYTVPLKYIPLTKQNTLGTYWAYIPTASEFKSTLPTEGDYYFKAKFPDGDSLVSKDLLGTSLVVPVHIVSATWVNTGTDYTISWNKDKVTSRTVSFYMVRLLGVNNNVLFASPTLTTDNLTYSFGSGTTGWVSGVTVPQKGDNCTVEVDSYQYDTIGDSSSGVQAIARAYLNFTWGQSATN